MTGNNGTFNLAVPLLPSVGRHPHKPVFEVRHPCVAFRPECDRSSQVSTVQFERRPEGAVGPDRADFARTESSLGEPDPAIGPRAIPRGPDPAVGVGNRVNSPVVFIRPI